MLAQLTALPNQLTVSASGHWQENRSISRVLVMFILALTKQGSIGETSHEIQAFLRAVRKMAGITSDECDEGRSRISTLEDRKGPYLYHKNPFDHSRPRDRSPKWDHFHSPQTFHWSTPRQPRRDRSGDCQWTASLLMSPSSNHQPGQQRNPLWDSRANVDTAIKLVCERNQKSHKDRISLSG